MKNFEELDLIAPLRRALADEKYETPTPIQAQTIPPALLGRDVLGCAQTGTGKTAAFAVPILNQLEQRNHPAVPNRPDALVLAPTRELSIQIAESISKYGKYLRLRQVVVYGGVSQLNQVRALNRGAHILVATPGRMLDLMNQRHIKLDRLSVFVLDEADRMLDMGFLPDLKRIISQLPERRQSLFFSATIPANIIQLSKRLLTNPINVNVTPKSTSVEKIEQRVTFVERSEKLGLLRTILTAGDVDRALVFTRTKRGANTLAERLVRGGIKATAIHGNKSQNARQRALASFRHRHVQVLVATDVAARGIDIEGISHVVNFDLPDEPESYVHRIGRTGRAGAGGIALSFCTASQRNELRAIERLIGKRVTIASGQPQQPQSEPREQRPSYPSRSRPRNAFPDPPVSKSTDSRSGSTGNSVDAVRDEKPKRRRRRRGRTSRQPVK